MQRSIIHTPNVYQFVFDSQQQPQPTEPLNPLATARAKLRSRMDSQWSEDARAHLKKIDLILRKKALTTNRDFSQKNKSHTHIHTHAEKKKYTLLYIEDVLIICFFRALYDEDEDDHEDGIQPDCVNNSKAKRWWEKSLRKPFTLTSQYYIYTLSALVRILHWISKERSVSRVSCRWL